MQWHLIKFRKTSVTTVYGLTQKPCDTSYSFVVKVVHVILNSTLTTTPVSTFCTLEVMLCHSSHVKLMWTDADGWERGEVGEGFGLLLHSSNRLFFSKAHQVLAATLTLPVTTNIPIAEQMFVIIGSVSWIVSGPPVMDGALCIWICVH